MHRIQFSHHVTKNVINSWPADELEGTFCYLADRHYLAHTSAARSKVRELSYFFEDREEDGENLTVRFDEDNLMGLFIVLQSVLNEHMQKAANEIHRQVYIKNGGDGYDEPGCTLKRSAAQEFVDAGRHTVCLDIQFLAMLMSEVAGAIHNNHKLIITEVF